MKDPRPTVKERGENLQKNLNLLNENEKRPHKESLFCPFKQQETRQDVRRDRRYYVGRCDERKCAWWHYPTNKCSITVLPMIIEQMDLLRNGE